MRDKKGTPFAQLAKSVRGAAHRQTAIEPTLTIGVPTVPVGLVAIRQ